MTVWIVEFDTRAGRGWHFAGVYASKEQALKMVARLKAVQHADFRVKSYYVEEAPEPTM